MIIELFAVFRFGSGCAKAGSNKGLVRTPVSSFSLVACGQVWRPRLRLKRIGLGVWG